MIYFTQYLCVISDYHHLVNSMLTSNNAALERNWFPAYFGTELKNVIYYVKMKMAYCW